MPVPCRPRRLYLRAFSALERGFLYRAQGQDVDSRVRWRCSWRSVSIFTFLAELNQYQESGYGSAQGNDISLVEPAPGVMSKAKARCADCA